MKIAFAMCLPREKASVPLVRRLLRGSLEKFGVEDESLADMELAVTEACTNVLLHARGEEQKYEVQVELNDDLCEVSVSDAGCGLDQGSTTAEVDIWSEGGRGIQLMRALVDEVSFVSPERGGTTVHMSKRLELDEDSLARRLLTSSGG